MLQLSRYTAWDFFFFPPTTSTPKRPCPQGNGQIPMELRFQVNTQAARPSAHTKVICLRDFKYLFSAKIRTGHLPSHNVTVNVYCPYVCRQVCLNRASNKVQWGNNRTEGIPGIYTHTHSYTRFALAAKSSSMTCPAGSNLTPHTQYLRRVDPWALWCGQNPEIAPPSGRRRPRRWL